MVHHALLGLDERPYLLESFARDDLGRAADRCRTVDDDAARIRRLQHDAGSLTIRLAFHESDAS